MRVSRVFIDHQLGANIEIELPVDVGHYLTRVLRLSAGAKLLIFNGQGGEYEAQLTSIVKNHCMVEVGSYINRNTQSPLHIHLGVGLSRGERMDLIIQKATELGVTSITPLFTERCEVKLNGQRLDKRLSHWQKISISACEQSGRTLLPEINRPVIADEWLGAISADIKLVLEPTAKHGLSTNITPQHVALFTGPEGGLTERELSLAASNEFQAISLGPRILRTETAPIAALSILQYIWGDF